MKVFVTGIGTDVGKTIVSAILCETLGADYWKPIQSGDLDDSDTRTVKSLVSNPNCVLHPEAYRLKLPVSPHQAAAAEKKIIRLDQIIVPETSNHLVIEGAGGVLVPLNHKKMMIDLIEKLNVPVILVSRHYLGSINHTLLTVEALRSRGIQILGIIFNGNNNSHTEKAIMEISGLKFLGRISREDEVDRKMVMNYAKRLSSSLKKVIR